MQQKKGDEYFQKHNYSPDTQLFDIFTSKNGEISIVPEHKPLKILHQFDYRIQIHFITLPCIAVSLPEHCRFA